MTNNKVIFADGTIFDTVEYPVPTEPSIFEKKSNVSGVYREVLRITVIGEYSTVCEKFVNNAEYAIRQFDVGTDEEGNEIEVYTDFDKSMYCIAGDIIDHRNGHITVYMGQKTEHEIEVEELNNAVDDLLIEVLGV